MVWLFEYNLPEAFFNGWKNFRSSNKKKNYILQNFCFVIK